MAEPFTQSWVMMGAVLDGMVAEFSDLSAVQAAQLAVRLVIAAVLGGLIGRDRERAGKAAGVRTHLLVAVGSAAFVAVPQQAGASPEDVTRVLQGLVAGIGFLGAGCIWKDESEGQVEGQVEGLTTAAGLSVLGLLRSITRHVQLYDHAVAYQSVDRRR